VTFIASTVVELFLQAGWFEGRKIALPDDFLERFGVEHPAAEVLREFAGLHVGSAGAGIECARSDIQFKYIGAENYQNRYLEDVVAWEQRLRTRLAGVGEFCNCHGELFIASDGRCFARSIVSDDFWFEGQSFGSAAESLLLGLNRARPLLLPEQESTEWFGRTITRDSPAVYKYGPGDSS
jgi:hypothetical protein